MIKSHRLLLRFFLLHFRPAKHLFLYRVRAII